MNKITFVFILLMFTSFKGLAQKVYYVNLQSDADLVVYEVRQKTDADILIKRVSNNYEVKSGFWKEVKTRNEANLIVYITDKNTTDVNKVYFTKYNDEVDFH